MSSAACDDVVTGGTRHVNKKLRHNLKHPYACWHNTNKISNFKTRHIVLPEDGRVGLKHVGVNDEIL